MAFRRWRLRQVVTGGRYRTGLDIVEVESVDVVATGDITAADAIAAGYASPEQLWRPSRPGRPARVPDPVPPHRRPDPRERLADDGDLAPGDVADLDRRLSRMDRSGGRDPWTIATLTAIGENPGVPAATLAAAAGVERTTFKRDVRRLKDLGLTLSLTTGYRLSPRGESFLRLR